jgi:hypothetical protein
MKGKEKCYRVVTVRSALNLGDQQFLSYLIHMYTSNTGNV